MNIPQKTADRIMERINIEDMMMQSYLSGKNDKPEAQFKEELKQWLDRKYPDIEIK